MRLRCVILLRLNIYVFLASQILTEKLQNVAVFQDYPRGGQTFLV